MRLIQDRFCEKNNCILVTGKGYPDLSTIEFLHKINVELNLPCYILVGKVFVRKKKLIFE